MTEEWSQEKCYEMSKEVAEFVRSEAGAELIKNVLRDCAYQSLDVREVNNLISERAKAAHKSDQQESDDRVFMIETFLKWGDNINQVLKKINENERRRIRELIRTYTLQSWGPNGAIDTITLLRVALASPIVTLNLLNSLQLTIPMVVPLPASDFGDKFPRTMQTIIAAAIMPKSEEGRDLMRALLLYLIARHKRIGNQLKNTPDIEILQKVISYARLAHVSSIVPQEMRHGHCVEFGMLNEVSAGKFTVSDAVRPAVTTFKQKFASADIDFV